MILRPKNFYRAVNRRLRQGGFICNTFWDKAFVGGRGGGSGPTQPTADSGLYGWWSSDTTFSLTGGGNLANWTDRSGNSRVINTPGDPNSPHVVSSDINGHTSVHLDTHTNNARYCSIPIPAKPFSVIWLFSQDSGWTNGNYLHDADNGDACIWYQTPSSPNLSMYAGSSACANANASSFGTWYVATCVWNGASSSMQINNTTAATGNPGTANAGAHLLCGFTNDGAPALWRFAGVIVTTSTDATNLTIHKNWLANYGGLSI
jgi:hypothetical protein